MPKDLRKMLKNSELHTGELSNKHRIKFEARLKKELHTPKRSMFYFLKIAASFIVVVGLGSAIFFFSNQTAVAPKETAKIESMGSISPELKKIENYYLASINAEIASLEESKENKELLDGYLEKIGELTKDYQALTDELNSQGLNVTGADLSKNSIDFAKRFENSSLRFKVHDMRNKISKQYDAIFNLFTSFGYFDEESVNIEVLKNFKKKNLILLF